MRENAQPPLSRRYIAAWFAALLLIAVFIRVHGVGIYHYSEDEAMHMGIAHAQSFTDVLKFSLYETHPPLGHILRYYWLKLDDAIWFARCLALLFGIALIPLYYCIGRQLNGQFTGLCCAALAAFGYGCVIQSYVVRNYTIYAFFLSAAFYCYLLWREERTPSKLWLYGLFSAFACLTHFSGILAIFSIAGYETLALYFQKTPRRLQITWAVMNLAIAAVALLTYGIWAKDGFLLEHYFRASSPSVLLVAIVTNPFMALGYLLPHIALVPVVIFLLFLPSVTQDTRLQSFLRINAIPFALGMFLVAIRHYYPAGNRQGIWVMPFIVPSVAWVVADACEALRQRFLFVRQSHIAAALLVLGGLTCNAIDRTQEVSEYQMKQRDWISMSDYLKTLDGRTVIVLARDDAILLDDVYPYLKREALQKQHMAMMTPYLHTHLLFNPYYRRMFTPDILLSTLKEAQARGLLDNIDTLVFMKTLWDSYPEPDASIPHLIICGKLQKHILSFPPFAFPALAPGIVISGAEEKIAPTAFMSVSKQLFFQQVIPPNGKAHDCLQ